MNDISDDMILIDGRCTTTPVEQCTYETGTRSYRLRFRNSDKYYNYKSNRITRLTAPRRLSEQDYLIKKEGKKFYDIDYIEEFTHRTKTFWRIVGKKGHISEYNREDLEVGISCLKDRTARGVFTYLQRIADGNSLLGEDGTPLLRRQYQRLTHIDDTSAAACYLNPKTFRPQSFPHGTLIYPFGCNASQKKAVECAFGHQVSVIEGPPGTGKTQTILNIAANIVCRNQTVLIVSNNNAAIGNVAEKLEKRHYGFMTAQLGSVKNWEKFVTLQAIDKIYPKELQSWRNKEADNEMFLRRLEQLTRNLCQLFEKQEVLARLKQEYDDLQLEQRHFERSQQHPLPQFKTWRSRSPEHIIALWRKLQQRAEEEQDGRKAGGLKKIWRQWLTLYNVFPLLGRKTGAFRTLSATEQITFLQGVYYTLKSAALKQEIDALEQLIAKADGEKILQYLYTLSSICLNHHLYKKYGGLKAKPFFKPEIIRQWPHNFLREYPIVLSTTFSSRANFGSEVMFDYVIMDEASQVSSDTALLALSCARNAVIVGDRMQLPNVVSTEDARKFGNIARQTGIDPRYDCAKHSFLDSLCRVLPDVPQTLLREHYRCHPKIINFCNRKFYGGQLMTMTRDKGESDVLSAIRTVRGNHSRDLMNQREIDVIEREVLPRLTSSKEETGIIAPYNNQVDALRKQLGDKAEIATVHKFQGRERETIVLSTVDDRITDFADDAHLLNVAVSRAKERFCLVTSGNSQPPKGNISDLLGYIEYNNFEVRESRIHSVFDYLYTQYTAERLAFLHRHRHVSEYASENLTYALIEEILASDERFRALGVLCHQRLGELLGNLSPLTPEERRYALNGATHIDFLIYNRLTKKAVMAIETDGYAFHKEGLRQAERDVMKDSILRKCALPLMRLSTTESDERRRITTRLTEILES